MTDLESAAAEIVRDLVDACARAAGYTDIQQATDTNWRSVSLTGSIARIVALAQDYSAVGCEAVLAPIRHQFAAVALLRPTPPPARHEYSPL
jgi:hypothetical protein